ncbi:MAG: hypothetical protein J6A28_04130 [Clostridia bacterium]|nr:hypothetical protein [Clostridia bacterium]
MYQGLSFEGYKAKVEDLSINVEVTDAEIASALKYSDPNKFYNILRSQELSGINNTYDKAQKIVSERANFSGGAARWKTEKCYQCIVNMDELLGLLCVAANERYFPKEAVNDCKQVVMAAVKKGADIYSPAARIIEGQKVQEDLYEDLPSTLETYDAYQEYLDKSEVLLQKTYELQKYSPYTETLNVISEVAQLQIDLHKAEEDGDRAQVAALTKELDDKTAHMNSITGYLDIEMLSIVAQGKSDLVRLTTSDPEKGETLKDQKEKAILATLYTKAKEIEAERLERQGLDDEIELKNLQKKNDDDDNK